MSANKRTTCSPLPWHQVGSQVWDWEGNLVCDCEVASETSYERDRANALLLASAGELFRLVQAVVKAQECRGDLLDRMTVTVARLAPYVDGGAS